MKRLTLLAVVLIAAMSCQKGESGRGLDAVQKRGELRVAMTGEFPPFNYYDEKSKLVGFDVDIANEVAKRMELPAKLITLRWDGILAGLSADRYDVIIGSMAITPERQKAVDFSEPYYKSGAQVFAKPDSKIAETGDLTGATVGVNLGTTYEKALRKKTEVEEIRTYNGVSELILDLESGRIDAFVTDRLVGFHANKARGAGFVAAGDPLYRETIGIALSKEQPELLAAINKALDEMKADGTYEKISKKWFGRDISTDS